MAQRCGVQRLRGADGRHSGDGRLILPERVASEAGHEASDREGAEGEYCTTWLLYILMPMIAIDGRM